MITYDDPAGREERERILAQLKATSPSQDVDKVFQPIEMSYFQLDPNEVTRLSATKVG